LQAAVLFVSSTALHAQVPTPPVPDSGTLLQQIEPGRPAAASSSGTGLRVEQNDTASAPPGIAFDVRALRISGNTAFATATLHALVADAEGRTLSLAQLLEIAGRITEHYRTHGYPLARAVIRAQVIRDGVVDLEVLEARYGRIDLRNRSRVDADLLRATLAPLQGGQWVSQAELDRALLLLGDIPGVVPDALLKPGDNVGTSDLQVDTAPGRRLAGGVLADNAGNRYTGRARAGLNIDLINPLDHGDVLSASVLGSGSGLVYGRLGYEALLNGSGTRAGGAYSSLRYSLGGAFEPLEVHGTARVASLWAKQPFLRGRDLNLYGQLRFDRTQLRDRIDATAIRNDRDLDVVTMSLAGDARDALLGGAINLWSGGWSGGKVAFGDAAARLADAATARTQGDFSRWHASLARLQSLGSRSALYIAVSGQWSTANLDSSQKLSVGGPYSVRGYDTGAQSGDTGVLATAELRRDLDIRFGRLQAVAFIDSAALRVNATPWVAGDNATRLSGVGLGLNWAAPGDWQIKGQVARRVGSRPETVAETAATHGWVEIRKEF
jgi:hemolysin activation/secretion protein